jgi:Flp pilus assembly pilin Flp
MIAPLLLEIFRFDLAITFIQTPETIMRLTMIIFATRALRVLEGRSGQSLAEYALVISFISLLSVVLMSIFMGQIRGILMTIIVALEAARSAI